MQSAVSVLLWFARYAGGGIVAFATPRLLVAAGVPRDHWIIEMGHAVSLHIDRESAIWLATLVMGAALYIGSVVFSEGHHWVPNVPGPLKDVFRTTPLPVRILIVALVLALAGLSVEAWHPSEQRRSATTVRQLQTYYSEADDYRREIIGGLNGSDEDFNATKKETDEWMEGVGHWVIDNMGMPAYHRLIQIPPEPNYSNGVKLERDRQLFIMTMIRDNLERLVENRSWDKQ